MPILHNMEFNDIIENNRKCSVNYMEKSYLPDNTYQPNSKYTFHRPCNNYKWLHFMETIRTDKNLQLLVSIAGILLLALIVGLMLIVLPLIFKLFKYISQYGVQEIVEYVSGMIDKIWKGTSI